MFHEFDIIKTDLECLYDSLNSYEGEIIERAEELMMRDLQQAVYDGVIKGFSLNISHYGRIDINIEAVDRVDTSQAWYVPAGIAVEDDKNVLDVYLDNLIDAEIQKELDEWIIKNIQKIAMDYDSAGDAKSISAVQYPDMPDALAITLRV